MRNYKKGIISIGSILLTFMATPFLGRLFVGVETADRIYNSIQEIPETDAGLVLGAAVYGEILSDILEDRVDTGIQLYKAGKIKTLVMSGGPEETYAMKQYAIKQGIPEGDIKEDGKGLNTLASIKNRGKSEDSITIVSQHYHLNRALLMATHLDVKAIGMAADKGMYTKIMNFKHREIWATSKAVLDVFRY